MSELISVKLIKQDSRLQPRAKMDTAIIDEYTESMKAGAKFPPVIVYRVGEEYFLVDGYHRYLAVQGAKFDKILAEVRDGTMRDAILFSAGANSMHGIRRTNDDKRRAVLTLLRDKEWCDWTDTKIAATCNVSVDLVATVRKSDNRETDCHRRTIRKTERNGKVIKIDTSKSGRPKGAQPEQPPVLPVGCIGDKCSYRDTREKILTTCGMSGKPLKEQKTCPECEHEHPGIVKNPAPVQPSFAAQMNGEKAPEPPVHRPPPCLGGGGCDQKPSRFVRDDHTGRGPVCDAVGRLVNQLPGNMCPYDVKLERQKPVTQAAPVDTGFRTGTGKADIIPPRPVPSQSRYPDSETKICEALLDFVVHENEAEATRELAKKEFDGDLPQTIREIFIQTFAGGA